MPEEGESDETVNQPTVEEIISNKEFVDKVSIELVAINDETAQVDARWVRCPVMATIWQLQKLVKSMLQDQNIVVCLQLLVI